MADEGTPPQRPVEIDERLEMALLAGYPREQHRDALHFPLLFSLRPPPVESPSFAPHHSNVRGPTLSRTPNLSNPVEREEEPKFRARTRTEDKRREPRKENKSASFRFRSCDGKPSIIYLDSIDTIFRGAIGDGDPGKETLYTYRGTQASDRKFDTWHEPVSANQGWPPCARDQMTEKERGEQMSID
ncbi:hypothetical protein B296_00039774 [Ensete ventricosum]|uniref:Uncharacterized protein n=1 Tax=Ensete ventricosum TaxID=4639 RepID=A0A426Y623_ENSVE|nr:hypothetical protein B296_00039774 [Ensete ventricosum]